MFFALAAAGFWALPCLGQVLAGNLYGTVTDNQGLALPGVATRLAGPGMKADQVTNEEGQFRFVKLAPGNYSIKAELEGFSTVEYPNIAIGVGRSTTIEVTMTPALEEVITVTSESPPLDERKVAMGTAVTQTELETIPNARDPWVILQQTPGVLVDRSNVGGNESGQQSTYVSPGTNSANSVWAMDGVVITDMGLLGSSPTYYNFDAFEEMLVTTGGTDASLATGGAIMNMVTKRGTNEWRAAARGVFVGSAMQSDADLAGAELPSSQQSSFSVGGGPEGNRIDKLLELSLEGGGPIVRDRLWIWGSYGRWQGDVATLGSAERPAGERDSTSVGNHAAKLNAQVAANNSLTAFAHLGDKDKTGRESGPTRPAPTAWKDTNPADTYKLEDTHLFSSNFYLTGMAAYVDARFRLAPRGGGIGDPGFPNVTRTPGMVWQNSFSSYRSQRPQRQAKLDGSHFFSTGPADHELRFGLGHRRVEVESFSTWPGQQLVGVADVAFAPGEYLGWSTTARDQSGRLDYTSAFLQDTLTLGPLTLNAGLRFDLQSGHNEPTALEPAPVHQGALLGGRFSGNDAGFDWQSVAPRLGLTYALGEDRNTLLRASYSRFADQLGSDTVFFTNPADHQIGYFAWHDTNRNLQLTADEVGPFFSFSGALEGNRPGSLVSPNRVARGLDAPVTDEILVSAEHALQPDLVLAATITWRRYSDLLERERLVREESAGTVRPHSRSDYRLARTLTGLLPDGTPYESRQYSLVDGVAATTGWLLENGDREQDYRAVTLSLEKRLFNRWSLRGHATWSQWKWRVPDHENEDPTRTLTEGRRDGEPVLLGPQGPSGNKSGIFIDSSWSFDVSGLYQIAPVRPWGFNVAANVNSRRGYPVPYAVSSNLRDGLGTRDVLAVADLHQFRLADVLMVNARIEKELELVGWGLTLSLDAFNLFDERYVLQREIYLQASAADWVREVVNPRTLRLGARLNFR